MARFKIVNGISVPLTPQEETLRDVEEATWAARHILSNDEIDTDVLNRILLEEGGITRALIEILFGVIKGTIIVNPLITKAQFITLLKSKMRS